MNTQFSPEDEPSPTFRREPFDEPRTIPGGWDYTALSVQKSSPVDPVVSATDSIYADSSGDQQSDPDEGTSHKEAFNQPRTYPAHWDITHLT